LGEQGNVEGFFNNIKNADKLGGMVEDIRDAVMDYQVRNRSESVTLMPDIRSRRRCSKISITKAVRLL
jgi:hypothetical protein